MTDLPIPIQVLYAGLGGTVLALIVATIQNKWSLRVFFILTLRLAIGWHFLFEGLHKIHSHIVGPTETNKPFSSEPYFQVADGPLGPVMRKQLGDADDRIKSRLIPQSVPASLESLSPNARVALGPGDLSDEEYAKMAPADVVKDWEAFVASLTEKYKLNEVDKKRLDGQLDDSEKAELAAAKELAGTTDPKKRKELMEKAGPGDLTIIALADYARWVVGVEARNSTVKYVSGDTPLTVPQRLEFIEHRKQELAKLQERAKAEMGNGYGHEMAKMKEAKALVTNAKNALLSDADSFIKDLEKEAFTVILESRFAKLAPPPSSGLGYEPPYEKRKSPRPADIIKQVDARITAIAPGSIPTPSSFDAVQADLKSAWDREYATFMGFYQVPDAAALETAYSRAKLRFANWYFDRDEFDGQPKSGFGKLINDYRKKHKLAETLNNAKQAKVGGLQSSLLSAASLKASIDATNAQDAIGTALDSRYNDLRKNLAAELPSDSTEAPVTPPAAKTMLEKLDWWTRWGIMAIGALLLAGLFTRLACVVGAGFLLMTYLTHPPFPWLPLPPGTEGNPVFVNKNVIEFLGLMVILVHPTGRWMGVDAIIHRLVFRKAPDPSA